MKKQTEKKKISRIKRSEDEKSEALKMYLRGLYIREISILLNIPVRTLEKWQSAGKWTLYKDCPEIKKRAYELSQKGNTYKEIAELLQINTVTVWRYIKEYEKRENK